MSGAQALPGSCQGCPEPGAGPRALALLWGWRRDAGPRAAPSAHGRRRAAAAGPGSWKKFFTWELEQKRLNEGKTHAALWKEK